MQGFSEILVAYTSSTTNNGQSFAGLYANTPFYNVTTALAMIVGRFAALVIGTALIVGALSYLPALALGPMVEQPPSPELLDLVRFENAPLCDPRRSINVLLMTPGPVLTEF